MVKQYDLETKVLEQTSSHRSHMTIVPHRCFVVKGACFRRGNVLNKSPMIDSDIEGPDCVRQFRSQIRAQHCTE